MNEDNSQGKNGYLFNVVAGVVGVILTLVIGYILTELSRLNGVIAERGERITRIEGRNDKQDDDLKRIQEQQGQATTERREIFDYLAGRKK